MKEGSKYYQLYRHLAQSEQTQVVLTFTAIEGLLGGRLPATARTHRAWWSNRSEGAVQAKAWMAAGYHVESLDLAAETVTFRKPQLVYQVERDGDTVLWNADLIKALRQHMGMNQGQFAKEVGVRQPTISEWETAAYEPKKSSSKLLTFIAERAGFRYE
jgi:DNA-binding transcriptional regulator YiaG